MKNLKLLLIIFALIMVSCNSDDDINPSGIVGTWELTGLEYTGTSTIDGVTVDYSGTGQDIDAQAIFSENPNSFSVSGTYTIMLKVIFFDEEFEIPATMDIASVLNGIDSGTWSINKNILTFERGGVTGDLTILKLTNSQLDLAYDVKTFLNGVEVELTGFYTFKKK